MFTDADAKLIESGPKTGELRPFRPRIRQLGGVVGNNLRFMFRVNSYRMVYTESEGFAPEFEQLQTKHMVHLDRGKRMVELWKQSRVRRMNRKKSAKMKEVKMYCWTITLMEVYDPYVRVRRTRGQASIIRLSRI